MFAICYLFIHINIIRNGTKWIVWICTWSTYRSWLIIIIIVNNKKDNVPKEYSFLNMSLKTSFKKFISVIFANVKNILCIVFLMDILVLK